VEERPFTRIGPTRSIMQEENVRKTFQLTNLARRPMPPTQFHARRQSCVRSGGGGDLRAQRPLVPRAGRCTLCQLASPRFERIVSLFLQLAACVLGRGDPHLGAWQVALASRNAAVLPATLTSLDHDSARSTLLTLFWGNCLKSCGEIGKLACASLLGNGISSW
jgi:hypothetical protein